MAIVLSDLILRVRLAISEIPVEMMGDQTVYEAIRKAYDYIGEIVPTSTFTEKEAYMKSCIVNLSAYYVYLSYTSIVEKQLGELPTTSLVRLNALKEIALAFLSPVTPFKLNSDLTVDDTVLAKQKALAFSMAPTILDMDPYEGL